MRNSYLPYLMSMSLISRALSNPIVSAPKVDLQTVHQFPNNTWIENMAIRKDGTILGTDISGSQIYLVDPQDTQSQPSVVAKFPDETCIAGIVEVEEDVFYTQSTICEIYRFKFQNNSATVWEVDMRSHLNSGQALVRKVVDIPAAGVLNGMTLLSKTEGTILMADSTKGLVWRLNVRSGDYATTINDTLLKPNASATPPFGVNGVHVINSVLYFSNTNYGIIGKFPISHDGYPTGPGVNISTSVPNADDFAVDSCGSIWLCENVGNSLVRVFPDGRVQNVIDGKSSSALIGPVAATFGRTAVDRDTLYISTDGLTFNGFGIPQTTNGKIAALNTKIW